MGDDRLELNSVTDSFVLPLYNLENISLNGQEFDYGGFSSEQIGSLLYSKIGDKFVVKNVSSITSGGGASVADVTTEVTNIISGQLSDLGGASDASAVSSGPSAYAPTLAKTDAENAVLSALSVDQYAPQNKAWVSAFGGGNKDLTGTPLSTVFGGIVAGSHARLSTSSLAGVMAGYVHSALDINSGGQSVMTDTGMLGAYFRSDAGIVRVDTSLIGGVSLHNSVRSTGIETATADFASWFLAPEIDGTIPILTSELGEISVTAKVKYVGGQDRGIHRNRLHCEPHRRFPADKAARCKVGA